MSRFVAIPAGGPGVDGRIPRAYASARDVQLTPLWMCLLSLSGCVIPPSLEEAPAPPNHAPTIVRDDQGNPVAPPPERVVSLSPSDDLLFFVPVNDEDVADTLTIRVFLDDRPVASPAPTPPTGQIQRTLSTRAPKPCNQPPLDSVGRLEAVVSDRGFLGDGRERPDNAGSDFVSWRLECLPSPDTDGGL